MSLRLRLSAYLDSIARDYPFGVPKVVGAKQSKIISFLFPVAARGSFRTSDEGKLLEAAITKGLKFDLEDVEVVEVEPSAQVSLSKLCGRVVVILGENCAARVKELAGRDMDSGQLFEVQGKVVVKSRELSNMLSDPQLKREFWGDLLRVQARL